MGIHEKPEKPVLKKFDREVAGRAPAVALCGASRVDDPEVKRASKELGFEVAKRGWTLVCGGMGGVMEAACRGVREARTKAQGRAALARCVGLLPGDSPFGGNANLDVAIPTGLGMARNALVVKAGDAVVLVNGASGTLSEAAMAWQLGRPIVALTHTGGWAQELARRGTLDERPRSKIIAAESVVQAMDQLEICFEGWGQGRGESEGWRGRGGEGSNGFDPSRREPRLWTASAPPVAPSFPDNDSKTQGP